MKIPLYSSICVALVSCIQALKPYIYQYIDISLKGVILALSWEHKNEMPVKKIPVIQYVNHSKLQPESAYPHGGIVVAPEPSKALWWAVFVIQHSCEQAPSGTWYVNKATGLEHHIWKTLRRGGGGVTCSPEK